MIYTINGEFIDEKIIENMDNSTASFNSLRFHDSDKKPANLTFTNNKLILSQEDNKNMLSTMLDVDFADKTIGIYGNLNSHNNIIFYPDSNESKPEVDKGIIFYNKNKKIVGSIHKDNKDKSDIVFRTGYSNQDPFELSEKMRIKNSEDRVKITGTLDTDSLCIGDTCLDKSDIRWIKTRGSNVSN